jgi:hypothetical protein
MFGQSKRFSEKRGLETRCPAQLDASVTTESLPLVPELGPAPGQYDVQGSLLVEDPTKKFGFIQHSKRFVPPKLGAVL